MDRNDSLDANIKAQNDYHRKMEQNAKKGK